MKYSSLVEGQTIGGFRAGAVYLNDSDRPMGARFLHGASGFTLDLLEIQSVPQAFVWTTTFPTSDMGEPHTQEHLLLGKGNKGRSVASHEPMSLSASSAFTMQWRTCYHFYTSAGADAFYGEFERRMDALLHPDYVSEEVHREVRNFGVTENPGDHSLGLEEKGSVYNEMVTASDQPNRRIFYAAMNMIYGANHPLQFDSGGAPAALRMIQPSDIQRFHAAHYHLANMGAVVSVPGDMIPESVLRRLDTILSRIQPQRPDLPVMSEKDLPRPKPAPPGEIRLVEYPHRSDQQPGSVWLVWPAERSLDLTERTLFEMFLSTFAGDPTTNLYRRFIDSSTREGDLGAQSVFGSLQTDQGFPVIIGFGDVPAARMNESELADLRAGTLHELRRVAAWKDGSSEVREFNNRLRSRVIQTRRDLAKFVNSPPGFGFRGNGSDWMAQLYDLGKEGGFHRSVTMKPVLEAVERTIAGDANVWAKFLPKWKLTGDPLPWALAARPNPLLTPRQQQEREARVTSEIARLRKQYAVSDDQEAIRRYAGDYDAATAVIDRIASQVAPPKFVDNPPMTFDDQLDYEESQLQAGIPMVTSTFHSMTSATTGIALQLDSVPRNQMMFLSLLPQLLTRSGVIEDGKPVSYQEMSERLRKEILRLNADFSTNPRTGRVELVLRGAGNDAGESIRSIAWMRRALFHPDWRPENLPRIRDIVDQALSGLRRVPQTSEENWVRGVATAFWRQDNPLFLATTSFMTQLHNVYRLRWMLKDAAPDQRLSAVRFLHDLAEIRGPRSELKARLAEIQEGQDKLMADAAKDIELTLPDIPGSSLAADWSHLCREMAADLAMGPERALEELEDVRRQAAKTGNARMFMIGAATTRQALAPSIRALTGDLDKTPVSKVNIDGANLVSARLRERDPGAANPVFVGLLNPNSQGGVFLNSAPIGGFEDIGRDQLLDYLSVQLYGGGGGHSIFMKTGSAGLAYSNGIGASLMIGRLNYYAERTPDLPQTLRFVIGELRKAARPDPALVEYAIAQAFTGSRSASSYETRGEAMAQNLADGLTPDIVKRFHQEILDLRRDGDLAEELYMRMPAVASRVLPGMRQKCADVKGGVYFVIGPEKQLAAWEEYLKSVEGPDAMLYRLYPRDFWA